MLNAFARVPLNFMLLRPKEQKCIWDQQKDQGVSDGFDASLGGSLIQVLDSVLAIPCLWQHNFNPLSHCIPRYRHTQLSPSSEDTNQSGLDTLP